MKTFTEVCLESSKKFSPDLDQDLLNFGLPPREVSIVSEVWLENVCRAQKIPYELLPEQILSLVAVCMLSSMMFGKAWADAVQAEVQAETKEA